MFSATRESANKIISQSECSRKIDLREHDTTNLRITYANKWFTLTIHPRTTYLRTTYLRTIFPRPIFPRILSLSFLTGTVDYLSDNNLSANFIIELLDSKHLPTSFPLPIFLWILSFDFLTKNICKQYICKLIFVTFPRWTIHLPPFLNKLFICDLPSAITSTLPVWPLLSKLFFL